MHAFLGSALKTQRLRIKMNTKEIMKTHKTRSERNDVSYIYTYSPCKVSANNSGFMSQGWLSSSSEWQRPTKSHITRLLITHQELGLHKKRLSLRDWSSSQSWLVSSYLSLYWKVIFKLHNFKLFYVSYLASYFLVSFILQVNRNFNFPSF